MWGRLQSDRCQRICHRRHFFQQVKNQTNDDICYCRKKTKTTATFATTSKSQTNNDICFNRNQTNEYICYYCTGRKPNQWRPLLQQVKAKPTMTFVSTSKNQRQHLLYCKRNTWTTTTFAKRRAAKQASSFLLHCWWVERSWTVTKHGDHVRIWSRRAEHAWPPEMNRFSMPCM